MPMLSSNSHNQPPSDVSRLVLGPYAHVLVPSVDAFLPRPVGSVKWKSVSLLT